MARWPHRYYKTIILSDRFHTHRHNGCARIYQASEWGHIPAVLHANTSASEQFNNTMLQHMDKFFSFHSPNNALNMIEFFLTTTNYLRTTEELP
jgi:hypothetical protein